MGSNLIKTFWCCNCCELQQDDEGNNIKEEKRRHVLGQDDEWYCEVCDAHHFNAIVKAS